MCINYVLLYILYFFQVLRKDGYRNVNFRAIILKVQSEDLGSSGDILWKYVRSSLLSNIPV